MTITRAITLLLALGCGLVISGIEIKIGPTIRMLDIAAMLSAGLLLVFVLPRGVPRLGIASFVIVAGAYALYIGVNAAFLNRMSVAIKEAIQLGLFLSFFIAGCYALRRAGEFRRFMPIFLACLWAVSLYNAGYHVSIGYLSGWKELDEPKLSHALLLLVLTAVLFTERPRSFNWRLMFFLAIVFVLLSGERKGWMAAGVGILVMSLISDNGQINRQVINRIGAVLLLVLGILAVAIPLSTQFPYVEKQLSSIGEFVSLLTGDQNYNELVAADTTISNRVRVFGIQSAMALFSEHYVFGVGMEKYVRIIDSMNIDETYKKGAHNELLRIGAELGSVGLALYFTIYATMIARLRRLLRAMPSLDSSARLRVRMGAGMMAYGFAINIFLGGGGVNLFFVFMPAMLLFSVPLVATAPRAPRRSRRVRWRTPPRPDVTFARTSQT